MLSNEVSEVIAGYQKKIVDNRTDAINRLLERNNKTDIEKNVKRYSLGIQQIKPKDNEIWREKISLIKDEKVIDSIIFAVEIIDETEGQMRTLRRIVEGVKNERNR